MSTEALNLSIGSNPTTAAGGTEAERRKVKDLAEQFEAMLMTQMLREMRRSMLSGLEDEDKSSGFGSDALTDTLDVQLGIALSRAGGFGLSSVLNAGLERMTGVGAGEGKDARPEARAYKLPAYALPANARPVSELTSSESLVSELLGSALPVTASASAPLTYAPTGTPMASEAAAAIESALATAPAHDPMPAGRVSSAFGWRNDPLTGSRRFHNGVDIAMPVGRDVVAAERGRVVFAGEQSGFGNTILIDHGNGRQTRYAHLSEQAVRAGAEVAAGQLIGKSGATGRVTGPHLHFEVLVNGQPVNPTD